MNGGSIALAARWEERVMRAAHPIAYPALNAVKAPVRRMPGLGILVTDATLLRAVLLDTEHFSKTGRGGPADLWTPVAGPTLLLNMEGAAHLALRRQLAPLFTPAWVDGLSARSLQPAVHDLGRRLAAGEQVELVAEVRRYSAIMISQIVGLETGVIDDGLLARVGAISNFVRLARPRLTPRQVVAARSVLADLGKLAAKAYAGDDSTLPGRMRALGLTEEEALGAVGAFVLTGTETLVSYVPRLIALLVDTGWLAQLRADRSLVDAAIGEGLRVTTPSPVMLRSVSAPTTIGRLSVRAGERVILATFAANRALGPFDPAANPAATLKQLWFGAGSHFCLGAPLAMSQIRLVVDAVLDAPSAVRVVSRSASRGVLIPSYRSLVLSGAARE